MIHRLHMMCEWSIPQNIGVSMIPSRLPESCLGALALMLFAKAVVGEEVSMSVRVEAVSVQIASSVAALGAA